MRAVLQSRWLQLKPYRRPLITDYNSPLLTAAVRGGIVRAWGGREHPGASHKEPTPVTPQYGRVTNRAAPITPNRAP